MDASRLMVVLAVAAVGTILVNESLSALLAKVILEVVQTVVVTELAVVAAVLQRLVGMLAINILGATVGLEFQH
jgi:hypothetical protein